MSSSRDNRRENRDLRNSLADKDGQIQALQERMLGMQEEMARKDIAITNLSGRVESLLEQKLQYRSGEFKEAKDETRYLDVCAFIIGKKVQLVREWLLEHGTNYVDTLDDVESLSYPSLLEEIKEIEGSCGEQLLHFFNRLRKESSPLSADYPQKPLEIYQLLSILLSMDSSKYRHPFSYIYNSYFLGKTSSKEAVDLFGKLLPGGISYSDGLHIRKKHVEDYKNFVDTKTFKDSLKADVFHVFDNNGVLNK
jgi:hypothetical protein